MSAISNSPKPLLPPRSTVDQAPQTRLARVAASMKNLLVDNPMLDESKRAQRKLFRTGKAAHFVSLALFILLYVWMIIEVSLGQSDISLPFEYIELTLITLLVPSSIYNAISGERERATWDALVLTRLTPGQIIFGKLLWRFRGILILAVLSIIPIVISRSDPRSFDNVTTELVASAEAMVVSWGVLLCCFGLWVSTVTKRSITSLAAIAGTLIALLIALPTLYSMFFSIIASGNLDDDFVYSAITAVNPYSSLLPILTPDAASSVIGVRTGAPQIETYLGVSIIFVVLTYGHLTRLSKPIRGRG